MKEKMTKIKLLIDESLRERLLEICGEENLEPYGENKFIVYYPFVEGDFAYNLLLGFGDKCECLEPPEVRNELIRRIRKLSELYNSK